MQRIKESVFNNYRPSMFGIATHYKLDDTQKKQRDANLKRYIEQGYAFDEKAKLAIMGSQTEKCPVCGDNKHPINGQGKCDSCGEYLKVWIFRCSYCGQSETPFTFDTRCPCCNKMNDSKI